MVLKYKEKRWNRNSEQPGFHAVCFFMIDLK